MSARAARCCPGTIEPTRWCVERQSGRQTLQLGAVSVEEVIDRALREAALQSPAPSMEKKIGPGLSSVHADPSALAQCIQNLISNAPGRRGRRERRIDRKCPRLNS